jgi:hypothetical protein
VAATIQSAATVIALLVAGGCFFGRRGALPRATIDHRLTHRQVTPGSTWLQVSIQITSEDA